MNKKCTLLATALMMAGTFAANAAANPDWTAGSYYYLVNGNNYISLSGTKADSVIVKSINESADTKAAIDSALWQISNPQTTLGVTTYQITNKATGQLLSFAASPTANLNLATGVSQWVLDGGEITGYYGNNQTLTLDVDASDNLILSTSGSGTSFNVNAPGDDFVMNASELGNGFSVFQLMFGANYGGNVFAGKSLLAKDLTGADAGYMTLQLQGEETFPNGKAKFFGVDTTKTVIASATGAYGAKFALDSTYVAAPGVHSVGNAEFQKFQFVINLKNDSLTMLVKDAPNVNGSTLAGPIGVSRVVYAQLGSSTVLTVSACDPTTFVPTQGDVPLITSKQGVPTTIPTGTGVYFLKSASKGADAGKYYVTSSSFMGGDSVPNVNQARGQWYIKESNGKYTIVDRQSNTQFVTNAEAFAVQGMANTYTFGNRTDSVTVSVQTVDLTNKYLGSLYLTDTELTDNGYALNILSGISGFNGAYVYTADSILKVQGTDPDNAVVLRLMAGTPDEVGGAQLLGDTLYVMPYTMRPVYSQATVALQGTDSLKFSATATAQPFTFMLNATGDKYMMMAGDEYVGMNVNTSCVQVTSNLAYVILDEVDAPEYGTFGNGHKALQYNNNSLVMNPLTGFAQMKSVGNPVLKADYVTDNFSLWVEQAKVVDGKQLYFISTGVMNADSSSVKRYYLAAKDTVQNTIPGTYAMFINNDTITTQANSPALFAFKTAEQGGFYLENQSQLVPTGKPYVSVVNGFAVMQADQDAGAVFEVATAEAPTNNDQVTVSDITVLSGAGEVIISNASGRKISVSNILGQSISSRRASSDYYSIPASKGVVLVTVEGDKTYKVIVK